MSPEAAAFANTLMVHYLNFDPGWRDLPHAGGFPGRTLPAILALAEPLGLGGRAVLTAATVAYDVCYRLVAKIDLHICGFNQSFYTAPASAAALVNLLGLASEQAAHAISMAAINSLRLRTTRSQHMPMWKNADCADGNRAVISYVQLAQEGMTAPDEPFEGKWGVWSLAGTEPQPLEPFGMNDGSFKATKLSHKPFPCHHHGMPAISMAIDLRRKVALEEIEQINVQGYHRSLYNVGGGPEKPERLDPATREDADHSIPFLVAAAFRDGAITGRTFHDETLLDPALRPLMRKVSVTENPEYTAQYPKAYPMSMEVVTRSGEKHSAFLRHYKGHLANPFTDEEIEEKFLGLAEEALGTKQSREALKLLWRIEELDSVTPLFDALTIARSQASVEV